MKIALVHRRLDRHGGTESDFLRTAEGLRDLGHELHLFCSEYKIAPPQGVFAHRVPVLPFGRTLRLWTFAWSGCRVVKRGGYDVVIGFGRLPRQDVLRSGGATHRGFLKSMATVGGFRRRLWQSLSPYHRSLLALEKRQYRGSNSKKIIAVSQWVKADIVREYSVPAEKIAVLYNGVDLTRFHPAKRSEHRERIRSRWHIPGDCPLVLFVGSGFRRKGLSRLLSVWGSPKLKRAFLLVVGNDARLERYRAAAENIAPGRVVFAGRRDDVENYYAAADVLALLSVQEAFGNVVLEALATGLPVLISRDMGAAEILQDESTEGIIGPTDNPEEIATKLLALSERSRDPCYRLHMRRVAESYSWESHFRRLEDLLFESYRSSVGAAT